MGKNKNKAATSELTFDQIVAWLSNTFDEQSATAFQTLIERQMELTISTDAVATEDDNPADDAGEDLFAANDADDADGTAEAAFPWGDFDKDQLKALAAELDLTATKPKEIKAELETAFADKKQAKKINKAIAGMADGGSDAIETVTETPAKADKAGKAAKPGKAPKINIDLTKVDKASYAATAADYAKYTDKQSAAYLLESYKAKVTAKGSTDLARRADALYADLTAADHGIADLEATAAAAGVELEYPKGMRAEAAKKDFAIYALIGHALSNVA